MRSEPVKTNDLDELNIIPAIWVLSSIDQNPMMTYRGIRYRLDLPEGYPLREAVQKRPDPFRLGVPKSHLDATTKEWRKDTSKLPAWLVALEPDAREEAINALKPADTFRSQFRIEKRAERSPLEIVTWGLEHIDSLRKAGLEEREANMKIWLIMAPISSGILAFLGTILAALIRGTS